MTQRERVLATTVMGVIALAGVAFLFNLVFLEPLAARQHALTTVRADIKRKQERIAQVQAQRAQLETWKRESLPGDTDQELYASTRQLYTQYLRELLTESELASPSLKVAAQKPDARGSPLLPGKKPIYTRLTFTVDDARGNLSNLVPFLERFYHSGMLHQIKKLSVQRPRTRTGNQQVDDLDISLTVEALVVNATEARPYLPYVDRRLVALDTLTNLQHGPFGLTLGLWSAGPGGKLSPNPLAQPKRRYNDIASKNVFFPPEEKPVAGDSGGEAARFVYLTDITHSEKHSEAFLYDRYNNRKTRLRATVGFNIFRVTDSQDETVVRGRVLRMNEREVYFQADDKIYVIHVGQNLEDALRNPLSESKTKELKLVAATP